MAFAWGVPGWKSGTINEPIDRHPYSRDKMAVRQGGREAVTHWETLEAFNGRDGKPVASLIACQLETGRTHQIRVHLAHLGHPLLATRFTAPDLRPRRAISRTKAQSALDALGRQALHAYCWFWSTLRPEK